MKKLKLYTTFTFCLFTFAFCLLPFNLLSQSCLPEGITFTTQAQIDSFQDDYPGCTEIEGDVQINGDDISNLNGLNVLTSIEGYLWIGSNNDDLVDLDGLEELDFIGGSLKIIRSASPWDFN